MIVSFTQRQWSELKGMTRDPLRGYIERTADIAKASDSSKLEVDMIPDAWQAVLAQTITCLDRFGHPGQTRMAAAKTLAIAVERHRLHPAFSGMAVVGNEASILPAWRYNDGALSAYVDDWDNLDPDRLFLLWPGCRYEGRVLITEWRARPAASGYVNWVHFRDEVVRCPA